MRGKLILAGFTLLGLLLAARLLGSVYLDDGSDLPAPPLSILQIPTSLAPEVVHAADDLPATWPAGIDTPMPTYTGTAAPTLTPAPSATPAPADTPAPTNAPALTDTPAPTDTPALIDTPALTDTPAPTDTPEPTDTPAPTDTPYPTPVPLDAPLLAEAPLSAPAAAVAGALNGVPLDLLVRVPDPAHLQALFAEGQRQGRNAGAFIKVGDSTMVWPPFLAAFGDAAGYDLGDYAWLQPAIDHFGASFLRESIAARKGMHTWSEFDPAWAAAHCHAGEGPLACEARIHNPAIAIIRLGANDAGAPAMFEQHMRRIIDYCLQRGIIPVLGTKPDRREGPANTINGIVYALAEEYRVPLWDYDRIAETVPAKGLVSDGVHFRGIGNHDYRDASAFSAGDSLQDLTALMMLEVLRSQVIAGGD